MKKHLNPKTIALTVGIIILIFVVAPYLFVKRVPIMFGDETFTLEVADTSGRQQRGLSGRSGLDDGTGMLFVFDGPGRYSFWMKDMLFPLDILWVKDDWCVAHIRADVDPETYPDMFSPPVPVLYVIELAAGEASRLGIRTGTCFEAPEL